ncbi:MAG: ATPase, T2SS/T4P/T4SS family [Patescibacteria group bacterium]
MDTQAENYYNFSNNLLADQSILDVFVLQNLIDQDDAGRIKKRYKTNREIEDFLIKNNIVTADTINKAYSIILKLPFIEIKNVEIPDSLKSVIPFKIARKFGIIPFSIEDGIIRLAVSRPSDLLVGYQSSIAKIINQKKLEVEIFITGESDFREALSQYNLKADKLLMKKGSLPVVYLRNQLIPDSFLNKIPVEFISKYRMVVFGQNHKGTYFLASAQPDSPITLKIVDFIKRENNIDIEVFATSKEDIDYVLEQIGKEKSSKIVPEKKPLSRPTTVINVEPQPEEPVEDKGSIRDILDSIFSPEPQVTIDSVISNDPNNKSDEASVPEKNLIQEPVKQEPKHTDYQADQISINQSESKTELKKTDENVNNDNDTKEANIGSLIETEITTLEMLNKSVASSSVPKVVAAIINFALNSRASDIHIEPESKILRVRCRIDGVLRDIVKLPLAIHPPMISRVKIMAKLKIDEARVPQDGRFDIIFKSKEVDVRVSTLPTVNGEKIVMRLLDKSQGILSLEDLGMQGSAFLATNEAIKKPYGIVLSTGPTGSGKSTTLYAILNRISIPGVNIVTLEDPVEYEIKGVNQCQIKPEIGFTFATGLRSILRQDPNIIMVGEIRDAETAGMATHAALTGHLVLSTLHTNDTAGALPRMINMGVEPFLITSSINLVIAQRLVRRICPKCREEMKVPQKLMDEIKTEMAKISPKNIEDRKRIPADFKLYYGKGCSECDHGYKGRIGIFEVMQITPEIEELAIAKKPASEIKEAAIRDGMITMKQDGIIKAFLGQTSIDEVFQAVINN